MRNTFRESRLSRKQILLAAILYFAVAQFATAQEVQNARDADSSETVNVVVPTPDESDNIFQRKINVKAEVRYRGEIDARRPEVEGRENAIDVHYLRTTVGATITPVPDVSGTIQVRDARTFGSAGSTIGVDNQALDLHQAFARLDNFLMDDLSAKLGRQEMNLGNQRLVGAVAWHNRGRTFDGVRFGLQKDFGSIDLFATRTNNTVGGAGDNQHFFGLWNTFRIGDESKLNVFALYDNNTTPLAEGADSGCGMLGRGTVGLYYNGQFDDLSLEVEGGWQGGTQAVGDIAMSLNDISAHFVSATLGYDLGDVDVKALYTRLSGDDDPGDSTVSTFITLFATNHKFYGAMDYFPALSGAAGLQDISVGVRAEVSSSSWLMLDGHMFMPAIEGDAFGTEIDLQFKHAYDKKVSIVAGFSAFLPADGFGTAIFGDGNGFWGFLMLTAGL